MCVSSSAGNFTAVHAQMACRQRGDANSGSGPTTGALQAAARAAARTVVAARMAASAARQLEQDGPLQGHPRVVHLTFAWYGMSYILCHHGFAVHTCVVMAIMVLLCQSRVFPTAAKRDSLHVCPSVLFVHVRKSSHYVSLCPFAFGAQLLHLMFLWHHCHDECMFAQIEMMTSRPFNPVNSPICSILMSSTLCMYG